MTLPTLLPSAEMGSAGHDVARCITSHTIGKLPPLASIQVRPSETMDRSHAIMAMRALAGIEIRSSIKRDASRYYVMDIHFKASLTRISTHRLGQLSVHDSASRERKPDLCVERRYIEFSNLRDEIYYYAHKSHANSVPCSFCAGMLEYTVIGRTNPSFLARLVNNRDALQKLLTRFVEDILRLTLQAEPRGTAVCVGQQQIPSLVQAFLLTQ